MRTNLARIFAAAAVLLCAVGVARGTTYRMRLPDRYNSLERYNGLPVGQWSVSPATQYASASIVSVSSNYGLVGGDPNPVLLSASRAGDAFHLPNQDYYFGDVILPPEFQADGVTPAGPTYWNPRPLHPGDTILTEAGEETPVPVEEILDFYYSPHVQRVYATQAGNIEVAWVTRQADENGHFSYYRQRSVVSLGTKHTPRIVFWTDGGFNGPPVFVPTNTVKEVNIVYNPLLPELVETGYAGETLEEKRRTLHYNSSDKSLHAYNRTGRVFVEWLGDRTSETTREQLGVDVVDVRKEAPVVPVTAFLGERLLPDNGETALKPKPVTQASGDESFFYDFSAADDTRMLYAERVNDTLSDVLVYWMREGDHGIEWPDRLNGYWLVWPEGWDAYSINVQTTGVSDPVLTGTQLPQMNTPKLVYQDDPDENETRIDESLRFVVDLEGDGRSRALVRMHREGELRYERVLTLDETAEGFPFYAEEAATVGQRVEAPDGADQPAGYIEASVGDAYNPDAYIDPFANGFDEAANGAIIPVNALPDNNQLEVWWFKESRDDAGVFDSIFWPSYVRTYTLDWPANPREIVLASNAGSGELSNLEAAGTIYRQPDAAQHGYNPNEEHALMLAGRAYALRDDLAARDADGAVTSSAPYVLIDYTEADGRPAMSVFKVLREKDVNDDGDLDDAEDITFTYDAVAGTILQAPMPLPLLPKPVDDDGRNGNVEVLPADEPAWIGEAPDDLLHYGGFTFEDRKHSHWVYRGPHDETDSPALHMRYAYRNRAEFDWPTVDAPPAEGDVVPYLRPYSDPQDPSQGFAGDPVSGEALTVTFTPKWPDDVPALQVAETLTVPKYGLPAVRGNTSLEVLYQQSVASAADPDEPDARSVTLFDPTRAKKYFMGSGELDEIPASIATTPHRGKTYFQNLPPQLRERFYFDPLEGGNGALVLVGEFVDEIVGEDYLQLNLLKGGDLAAVKALCLNDDQDHDAWDAVVDALATTMETFAEDETQPGVYVVDQSTIRGVGDLCTVDDDDIAVDSYALTAAGGTGTGYVTLLAGNGEAFTPEGEPVQMHVFKVVPKLYQGQLKVLLSSNPLDEQVTLRHTGDFAGAPTDGYVFEWKYLPPVDGGQPVLYDETRELMMINGVWDLARWGGEPTENGHTMSPTEYLIIDDGEAPEGTTAAPVTLTRTVTPAFDPLAAYFSINLGDWDGFALSINGTEALRYRTPDAADSESSPLGSLPDDFAPLDIIFELPPRYLDAGAENTLELALYTTAVAGTSYPVQVKLEGTQETDRSNEWLDLEPLEGLAEHTSQHTIGGAGILTLTDNYVTMRYQARGDANPTWEDDGQGGNANWSRWMSPALVEGWIKRVLAGINPFKQRTDDLFNNQVNTDVSILTQAGTQWEGDIALNLDSIDDFGLIEIYETVLNRGKMLSIDGAPAIDYGPANDALLLAAGYLCDLYMQLGNEAYADALNPTIAFDTEAGEFGAEATSLFAFKGQMATVLEEELGLLRGRDDAMQPGVETAPCYNRLYWNYTRGIDSGEVVYALNYNIREKPGDEADGTIDAADAARLFPQGHGDAYGHYLTATKGYYHLLGDDEFSWGPRTEAVSVLGQPVQVDYMDERKFAAAAAALARTSERIASLEHRRSYLAADDAGWGHLCRDDRDWSLQDWASRGVQGAYYNWTMVNALLPEVDDNPNHSGIQKIDRTTVPELDEIVLAAQAIQSELDSANNHVNPLGIPPDSVSFDISPSELEAGKTHFEQVYERALKALGNAELAFDRAARNSARLRSQETTLNDYQQAVFEQEWAYTVALIGIYGMPYPGDIGPGKTYEQGYDGPDLYRYMYIDKPTLFRTLEQDEEFTIDVQGWTPLSVNADDPGALDWMFDEATDFGYGSDGQTVTYQLQPGQEYQFAAQDAGKRTTVGAIQEALNEVFEAEFQLRTALGTHEVLKMRLDRKLAVLENELEAKQKAIDETASAHGKAHHMQRSIAALNTLNVWLDYTLSFQQSLQDAHVEAIPKLSGLSNDFTSAIRGAVKAAGAVRYKIMSIGKVLSSTTVNILEQTVTELFHDLEIDLAELNLDEAKRAAIYELEGDFLDVFGSRFDIDRALARLTYARQQVLKEIANGETLLAERELFRKRAAAVVHGYRTRDLVFRLFRDEALEQYRTLFDTCARYSYLAASAYDYETGLLGSDQGRDFLSDIVSARALGVVDDGQPQFAGADSGDPGLSSRLAELDADWQAVRTRLGFNNPDDYGTTFSLRYECFRASQTAAGDEQWQQTLDERYVTDLASDPDVLFHCLQLDDGTGSPVPGFIIEFSTTVQPGVNFFGQPLAGTDHVFSSSSFATKIHAAGIVFDGYVGMDSLSYFIPGDPSEPVVVDDAPNALSATPYVYLIPAGTDIMRVPPLGDSADLRAWDVHDHAVPLPFDIGNLSSESEFWTTGRSLNEPLFTARKHQAFRAVDDPIYFNYQPLMPDLFTSNRLVGRSVWNTSWKLVIPAQSLHHDTETAKTRFLNSVDDILLYLKTYSYSGN